MQVLRVFIGFILTDYMETHVSLYATLFEGCFKLNNIITNFLHNRTAAILRPTSSTLIQLCCMCLVTCRGSSDERLPVNTGSSIAMTPSSLNIAMTRNIKTAH